MMQVQGLSNGVALTYHDVIARRGPGALWFDCTAGEFRTQMEWLRGKGARFVSVAQVEEALAGRAPLPKGAVLVTFADDYLGFFTYAWPVCRKMKIPVALFVHTDFVGAKVGRAKMDWATLKALARTGLVTVASQTRTHPADLRALSDARLREEFAGSKRAIERRIGPCRSLAYPNGKYDARVARIAREAGYALAFTEVTRPMRTAPDAWRIPRYVHTRYRSAWADGARAPRERS